METIDIKEIDFDSLNKFTYQGNNSITYVDKNKEKFYKKITGLRNWELMDLHNKLLKIEEDGFHHERIILPEILLMDNDLLKGYITKYIKDATDIGIKYNNIKKLDVKSFMNAIYKTSLLLKETHDKGLIIQEMNFGNILEDNLKNIYFCDLDSCKYDRYETEFISFPLFNYIGCIKSFNANQSIDNFSLYLSMLVVLFNEDINNLSQKKYDEMAEKYDFLNDTKQIFKEVKYHVSDIYDFPYIHEIISEEDISKIKVKN